MSEEQFLEDEIFDDELERVWIVAEALSRDITEQLADLQTLKGAAFISMLKEITQNSAFSPLEGESNIYITGAKRDHDYDDLLNAAHKAVEHGYTVYMLPLNSLWDRYLGMTAAMTQVPDPTAVT